MLLQYKTTHQLSRYSHVFLKSVQKNDMTQQATVTDCAYVSAHNKV